MLKIKFEGAEVEVAIKGTKLVFTRNGRSKSIPLAVVLANMTESRPDGVSPADWVDLGTLEARLMVHAEEGYTTAARAALFNIVRGMRNERREDRDLPPVVWNQK